MLLMNCVVTVGGTVVMVEVGGPQRLGCSGGNVWETVVVGLSTSRNPDGPSETVWEPSMNGKPPAWIVVLPMASPPALPVPTRPGANVTVIYATIGPEVNTAPLALAEPSEGMLGLVRDGLPPVEVVFQYGPNDPFPEFRTLGVLLTDVPELPVVDKT